MSPRQLRILTAAFAVVGLAVVLATFSDYGVTWDEPVQSRYGEGVLRYFASGLTDRSVDDFLHMRFYGPLFELAAAVAYAPLPAAKYEIRHLMIALTGLLTVLGVLRFGTRLPGRLVPFFAPFALVALPRFYGHAFNNSKDIPFACAFVWAVHASCRLADRAPGPGLRRALVAGLAVGAALATRPGGLPLLLLLFGGVLGWRALVCDHGRPGARLQALRGAAVAWAVAWLVMVALWPWAHEHPVENPLRAIAAAFSFPDTFPVLFEGSVTRSDALPRYYLAKYLVITTPLPVLLLALGGLGVAARRLWRAPRAPEACRLLAVGTWLLAPVALATVGRPNVYDGMRHLLFALPALALCAGIGAASLVETVTARAQGPTRSPARVRAAATAGLAGVIATAFVQDVRLHPYQSTYFNALVGGVAGAQGRYETDYWLSSYKEAIEWIDARAATAGHGVNVLVAADRYSSDCAAAFLGPGVHMTRTTEQGVGGALPEPFDFYVGTTRYGLDGNFPASPIAHRVGRAGATFTVIRAREPGAERGLADR